MATGAEIAAFLAEAEWTGATRADFPADFSSRRYTRLTRQAGTPPTAILMMAQPDQKTEIFVQLAYVLRRMEIPAPEIYASDIARDLVLMEDFGSANLGDALDAGRDPSPYDEEIVRLLTHLHARFDQTMVSAIHIPLFNAALFIDQATLFLDHYFKRVKGRAATARERSAFVEAWHVALAPVDALPRSLLLRDFMPNNTMILDKPLGGFQLGVLDFQDAGIGPVAYDLASWCEDVRRDGGLYRLEGVVRMYAKAHPGLDPDELLRGARVLSAQRHTRILGILAKLNKKEYIPRVQRVLRSILRDDALADVRRWFEICAPLI